MSAPHHSIFYRPHALPDAQPTVPKHTEGNNRSYITKLVPCWTESRLLLGGFQALVTLTLNLCITHRALSTHHISLKLEKLFLWMDYPQAPLQVQGHVTQKLGQIEGSMHKGSISIYFRFWVFYTIRQISTSPTSL